jgi:hypothetical protein
VSTLKREKTIHMPSSFPDEEPYKTIAQEEYKYLYPLERGLNKFGKHMELESSILQGWWYKDLHDKTWDNKKFAVENELSKPKWDKAIYLLTAMGVPAGIISIAPQHFLTINITTDYCIFLLFLLAFSTFVIYLALRKSLVIRFNTTEFHASDSKTIPWSHIQNIIFVYRDGKVPNLIIIKKDRTFKRYNVTDFELNKLRFNLKYWWKNDGDNIEFETKT